MIDTRKILILHSDSRGAEREFILGIARYANLHTNWILDKEDPFYRHSKSRGYTYLLKGKFDGIFIAGALYEKVKHLIDPHRTPVIVSSHYEIVPGIPNVKGDWDGGGKMAAEHLLGCGLKNFGFCGFPEFCWSNGRQEGFIRAIEKSGYSVSVLGLKSKIRASGSSKERARILKWLISLPKPVGIMAGNDDLGRELLEICKVNDLKVPDEIAVIGSDNDELICKFCYPPLTSIEIGNEKAGYEASRLMDELLTGKESISEKMITVTPIRIVTRQSTNTMAVEDQNIVSAIRYIRQNKHKPLRVQDVVDAVCISRRALQRKFKTHLHSSLHMEINNVRCSVIEQLLLETTMSISQIAEKLNFSGEQNLARFFKKMRGISPNEYRSKQMPGR